MVDFDVNVKLQAGNAQSQLRQMERGLQSVETQAQKATGGFSLMGAAVTGAMTALSTAAINAAANAIKGLGAAVAGSLNTFAKFESSMNNVAALSGAAGSEFDQLEKKARQLGASTRYSASEVADAMGFLAMAGFETGEILASTNKVLDLAAASNMDLAQAADIASNVMGQFSISAQDTDRVTNVLAATAASANTNVQQLAEAMNYLGPTANSLGVSLEETAAVIGVLGDSGIQASAAGRALGSALVRLSDPTNKIAGAMQDLNLQVFDANGEFVSMEELLRRIERGMEGFTDKQKTATLSALLGTDAYQEINILLERGADAYAEYRDSITDTNRAAEIAETQSQGLGGAWKTLMSAAEGLAIAMGQALAPAVQSAIDKITEIITVILGGDGGVAATSRMAGASESLALAIDGIDGKSAAAEIQRVINAIGGLLQAVEDFMNSPIVEGFMWFMGYWAEGFTAFNNPKLQNQYRKQQQNERAIMFGMEPPNPGYGTRDSVLNNTFDDRQRQSYNLLPPPPVAPPSQETAPTNTFNRLNGAPPPPDTTPTSSAMNSAAQQATSKAQAIASAARQLGVSPLELAALFSFESAGTFNPGIKGGDGGNYWGLWQAGGPERQFAIKALGLPPGTDYSKLSFEQQVAAFVPWAASRGYKPGMGQRALYSTILTGGPGENRWGLQDSNGTSVLGAPIGPGSSHWLNAEKFLASQNFNNASLQYTESFADSLFNQEPFLTNPMAVGLGDPLNLAGLMKEAQKQVALEDFDEANRGLLEQIELIERKLELADMDATQREHILEIEALERESRAQLAEREEQLNELVKEGALNDDEKAQQLAELITILERYKLAVLDTQEAEQKAIELQELNTRLQEQAQKRMERIAEQQARAREYVDQLTNGFTNLAVSVISGASSMEQALSQFFNTILSYLANQAFQSLFGSLFNGLFGLGGFGGGGLSAGGAFNAAASPSGIGGFIGSANGNVLQGGFQAFANGGVVTRPTLGLIGEGSMNEAVVPLPDGRRIPVQMQGGGGTNITVNVNNPSSGEDGRRLGRQISEAIRSELVNQRRTGGLLAR